MNGPETLALRNPRTGEYDGELPVTPAGEVAEAARRLRAAQPDWAALAATGTTLVIYMGMSRLSSIQAGLRAAGLPAEMPAAVIERAASPDERVLVTSLGLLAREAQLGGYASPAVIVVGEVVALATVREAELRRCWARCA